MKIKNDVFEIDTNPEELQLARLDLIEVQEKVREIESEININCHKCKRFETISKYSFAFLEHYIPPSGCMGGDYWVTSGIELVCPHCGATYRFYKSSYNEKDENIFKHLQFLLAKHATELDKKQV